MPNWRRNFAIRPATSYVEDPEQIAEVLEDRDEYVSENVFWVPADARWEKLLAAASQPDIAKRIDDALSLIEHENPGLRNVLPRVYARAPLSEELMGSLVETIAKIGFGTDAQEGRDILGRTYEYFIKEFARAEGHRGGEFFTPAPVARLLVEMLEPYEGRVLDPACGSCGLFVQSARFIEAHGGRPETTSAHGSSGPATRSTSARRRRRDPARGSAPGADPAVRARGRQAAPVA